MKDNKFCDCNSRFNDRRREETCSCKKFIQLYKKSLEENIFKEEVQDMLDSGKGNYINLVKDEDLERFTELYEINNIVKYDENGVVIECNGDVKTFSLLCKVIDMKNHELLDKLSKKYKDLVIEINARNDFGWCNYYYDRCSNNDRPLFRCIENNDMKSFKILINNGYIPHISRDLSTLLISLYSSDIPDEMKDKWFNYLVSEKLSIKDFDGHGGSALYRYLEDHDKIKHLLDAGSTPLIYDSNYDLGHQGGGLGEHNDFLPIQLLYNNLNERKGTYKVSRIVYEIIQYYILTNNMQFVKYILQNKHYEDLNTTVYFIVRVYESCKDEVYIEYLELILEHSKQQNIEIDVNMKYGDRLYETLFIHCCGKNLRSVIKLLLPENPILPLEKIWDFQNIEFDTLMLLEGFENFHEFLRINEIIFKDENIHRYIKNVL